MLCRLISKIMCRLGIVGARQGNWIPSGWSMSPTNKARDMPLSGY